MFCLASRAFGSHKIIHGIYRTLHSNPPAAQLMPPPVGAHSALEAKIHRTLGRWTVVLVHEHKPGSVCIRGKWKPSRLIATCESCRGLSMAVRSGQEHSQVTHYKEYNWLNL